jgi:chondroitin 4-sulfotransferase 11
MPVYHSLKTILVRVPKTASTSISSKLHFINAVGGGMFDQKHKHEGITDIKKYMNKNSFDACDKISFVRNPFDWLVSCHSYYKSLNKNGIRDVSDSSFEQFIKMIEKWHKEYDNFGPNLSQIEHPYQPQYKYLVDENEDLIVDHIGKYEHISEEWDRISEEIGIKDKIFYSSLSKQNASKHGDYREYYTNELADIVKDVYKKDFEMFNYEFIL